MDSSIKVLKCERVINPELNINLLKRLVIETKMKILTKSYGIGNKYQTMSIRNEIFIWKIQKCIRVQC